jgi:hypothetical protein
MGIRSEALAAALAEDGEQARELIAQEKMAETSPGPGPSILG